jgi:hypothetical protein
MATLNDAVCSLKPGIDRRDAVHGRTAVPADNLATTHMTRMY